METRILSVCIFFIFSFSCLKAQDTLWIEVTDSSNMDLTLSGYLDSLFGAVNTTDITTGYLIESAGLILIPENGMEDITLHLAKRSTL